MKKTGNLGIVAIAIVFVVLSVVVFLVPINKTGIFWVGYIFFVIAFAMQIVIWVDFMRNGTTPKSKFLGLPFLYVGTGYLIVQIIISAIIMLAPMLPAWIALVLCILNLGAFAVSYIGTYIAHREIVRVEERVQTKVNYIRNAQNRLEILASKTEDHQIQDKLRDLANDIRFSDPMSDAELEPIEHEIYFNIDKMSQTDIDLDSLIKETKQLVVERNIRCKTLK